MTQKPSIGRQVHYVLENGAHRAATIVNAWPDAPDGICNLTVHLDGCNDFTPGLHMAAPSLIPPGAFATGSTLSVGSAHQDETAKLPGTWHWPEREG